MTTVRSVSIVSFVLFFICFGFLPPTSPDEPLHWLLSSIGVLLAAELGSKMKPHRSLTRETARPSRCDLCVKGVKITAIAYLTADFTLCTEPKSLGNPNFFSGLFKE